MNAAARRSFEWVCSVQPLFDFRRSRNPSTQLRLLKPFSELVLTLSLLKTNGFRSARMDALISDCWTVVGEGQYVWQLLWARPELVELLGLLASFSRIGLGSPRLSVSLAEMFKVRQGWGTNLPPWRRMAVFHALDCLELHEFPAVALQGSFLLDQPRPWTISDDLAYGLTHEVFYVTDFGAKKSRLPEDALEYLRFSIPMWIEVFALQKNWDLLAELVMSAYCIGLDVSRCITQLLRAQLDADGSVRGPKGAGRDIPARTPAERHFANSYHTTLVTLMALADVGKGERT